MADAGFVEGRNFAADYRWAEGDPSRMPGFAADLVARRTSVIVTTSEQAITAAKQATSTIPIVFNYIADPVRKGFVASITHPGGNITGIEDTPEGALEAKSLQLLQEALPTLRRVGHLVAEQELAVKAHAIDVLEATANKIGIEVTVLTVGKVDDLEHAFTVAGQRGIGAILVGSPSAVLFPHTKRILEIGSRHKMPLVLSLGNFVVDGGLMAYRVLQAEVPSLTANYVVRILKGQKPAELPVLQPTRFTLSLNLKTAKALGLGFPPSLLGTAEELIE